MAKRHLDESFVYLVQPGDTLSSIAKNITGDYKDYLEIAAANGIMNPDLIYSGQKIIIPKKMEGTFKFDSIPNSDRKYIIEDYPQSKFNYYIAGDKVYYSRKGVDSWVDISDNNKARKNLLLHLENTGRLENYNQNEKEILNRIKHNNFDYDKYHDSINSVREEIPISKEITTDYMKNITASPIRRLDDDKIDYTLGVREAKDVVEQINETKNNNDKRKRLSLRNVGRQIGDYLDSFIETVDNGITRKIQKRLGDNDPVSKLIYNNQDINTESNYQFIPQSYTGDTVYVDKNKYQGDRYILPESLNLSDYTFGYRNRGSYEDLEGNTAPITIFNSFDKKPNIKNKNGTFIGVDEKGNIKIGNYDEFTDNYYISRTYGNVIKELKKDDKGNLVFKDDAKHGNPGRSVPITINYNEDGSTTEGSLNILTSKNKLDSNTYGNVTGGRVIIKTGNETRLISGSIDDINNEFEEMKKRNNVDRGTFYTLDNGSYNRGLRIKGRNISSQDLRSYDAQNTGGGNFLYIKGNKQPEYESDTVRTPNIRTINDESYKKGHSIENAQKGIVLHYTAFDNDDDLTNVTKYFQDPKKQASAHVVISPDGKRRVFANPNEVTFHAGYSMFNNISDVNDFMLGVEFQNPGNKPLTQQQINSFIEYAEPIIRQNNIPLENLVTHEDVRRQYKEYLTKNGKKKDADKIPDKHDLTEYQYKQIIDALIGRIYGYKPNTKRRHLDGD